jgi:eukaryotic-like serine/threonine-protein kinase
MPASTGTTGRHRGRTAAHVGHGKPGRERRAPLDFLPMDTTVADALNGALVGGRYRIRGRLAKGGLATVYHALDERLERTVAVKVIDAEPARDPRFVHGFLDEAKTAARLTHPNVVAVFDQGTHDGLPYLVMEFVRGRSLRDLLHDRHRLHPTEALAVLEQVLAALAAAHRAHLVHRDLRPENILVAPPPNGSGDLVDAVVKVADLGLARVGEAVGADGRRHAVAGYVAPELVSTGRADPRSDVYSAGILLFEMITGRLPFDGPNQAEVAWQHVDRDVPPPSRLVPGLPASVDELVRRATARDPARRPADASAMLQLVQQVHDDLGTVGPPSRVLGQHTVPVAQLDPRPAWARLPVPAAQPARRRGYAFDRTRLTTALTAVPGLITRMRATQRGRWQLATVFVVVFVLLVIGGWWLSFGRYARAPSLLNLTRANAVVQAGQLGYHIAFGPGIFSEQVPKDTVMRQQPGPGQRVVRGGTILLDLSLGPERYVVPEVVGQSADFALTELRAHFVVQQVAGYSDTLPVNYVVATDPPEGTPLRPSSTVKIVVAKGPYPAHVPNVVGQQLADAQAALQGQGFQVDVVEQDSTRPFHEVLQQNPPANTGVATPAGTKVTLTVSRNASLVMPDVTNESCGDARNQLQSMGLQVNADGQDFLPVREQDPPPNTPVAPGQAVTIHCRVF